MPPLSAYTPFESLLFFQCLASLTTRPASFADISDTLRRNRFVKENAAFDSNRLSPDALEELYTTLLQEAVDDGNNSVGSSGKAEGVNGGLSQDSANSKKRKIASTSNAVSADQLHTAVVPSLVTQLYARYKDRVTREIREEEQKYNRIRDEIDQLQKQEAQRPAEPVAQHAATTKALPGAAKPGPASSTTMDVDMKDIAKGEKPGAIPPGKDSQTVNEGRQQQGGAHPTHQPPKPGIPPISQNESQKGPPLEAPKQHVPPTPVPPVITPARTLQPQPQIPESAAPPVSVSAATSKPAPKTTPTVARDQQPLAPQPAQISPAPKVEVKVPSRNQPSRPVSHTPSRPGPAPGRNQPTLPPGSTIVFQAQQGPSTPSIPRYVPPGAENAVRQGVPVPTGIPIAPHIPPGQQPFPQWTPHHSSAHTAASGRTPGIVQPEGRPITTQQQHNGQAEVVNTVHGAVHSTTPTTPGVPGTAQMPLAAPTSAPQTPLPGTPSLRPGMKSRPSRTSMETAGSLTPWKRTPSLSISIPDTPGSPPRPQPGDVSPISDRAPSPVDEPANKGDVKKPSHTETGRPRRDRKQSVPPPNTEKLEPKTDRATPVRRGRSAASREDDDVDTAAAQKKIKDEAPGTPAGISEDTEAETRSASRPQPTATAGPSDGVPGKGRPKRKRGASEAPEIESSQPTPLRPSAPQLVYCTRNFPRTGAPLMNDVSAHKHASIFGKPLTEREAPGYRDLIYRPQDLKTIRSALNQGNRAVAATTESFSTPVDGESPNPAAGTPSKNAAWLPKTADLIPPKAIVNSSQLEKELIRMFANAVMFNPAPENERGFGPSFPMGKVSESRSSSQPWELDEGGIFRDTREMCDDVEKAVTKWRAAERTTADDMGNKNLFSLRGNSGENADNTDSDIKG